MSDIKRGDFVSWDSSGGRARGKVVKVVTDGKVDGIPVKITGTEEEPAAKIKLYKNENGNWVETKQYVGHKIKTLRKIKPVAKSNTRLKKIAFSPDNVELKVVHKKTEGDDHYYIAPDGISVERGRSADDVICEVLNLSIKEYRRFMLEQDGAYMGDMGVDFEKKEQAKEAIDNFVKHYDMEYNRKKHKIGFDREGLEVVAKKEKITNYPKKGDNQKVTLKNSQFPQFDWEYAAKIKEEYPEIWKKGGNIRGNEAYNHWTKAKQGKFSPATLDWIKEREAWMARHEGDFRLAGIVAVMKWGGICTRGMSYMKKLINEEKKKINERRKK